MTALRTLLTRARAELGLRSMALELALVPAAVLLWIVALGVLAS